MIPAKMNVFFSFYPYGTNGGTQVEHPSAREWFARTMVQLKQDSRIGEIFSQNFADTPPPMNRNNAVCAARDAGADVLFMLDSDNHPDLYLGNDPNAKPFFESSFDFLYKRKMQGLTTAVGAPYCGPPPNECVYVFEWVNNQNDNPNPDLALEMVQREKAASMVGIQPAAALPTGCIMFDMSIFDLTDPIHEFNRLVEGGLTLRAAKAMTKPWFYYEWDTIYQAKKGSTEDVTATRDMSLVCLEKLGYDPVFCNWDAWAGHYKPKCVGKPAIIHSDHVNTKFREAVLLNRESREKFVNVSTFNRPDVLAQFRRQLNGAAKE